MRGCVDWVTIVYALALFTILMLAYTVLAKLFAERATKQRILYERRKVDLASILTPLSVDGAKAKAMSLLANSHIFHCTQDAVATFEHKGDLTTELQDLFCQYGRIETADGDAYLDRRKIALSAHLQSHVVLGYSCEEDLELVAPSGSNTVLAIDTAGTDPEVVDRYMSIYHWIVAQAYWMNMATNDRDMSSSKLT